MFKEKGSNFFTNILVGTVIGGVLAFLFSPKKGEDLRNDLKEDLDNYLDKVKNIRDKFVDEAQKFSDDLYLKVEKFNSLIEKYSHDSFKEPKEKIEKEIESLKKAVKMALESYKENCNKPENSTEYMADDIFIDFVNENLDDMDDDLMPKHESMHKRSE